MKKTILIMLLISCGGISIRAQSVSPATLNATGGSAVIGSNEFEWSVGEMTMVSTFSSASVIITQGVLQPAPSTEGVPTVSGLSQLLRVFPNPASSLVNIEYTSKLTGDLTYKLLDIAGKTIRTKTTQIKPGIATVPVDISELACASYMLEVIVNSGSEKSGKASFEIQKIK